MKSFADNKAQEGQCESRRGFQDFLGCLSAGIWVNFYNIVSVESHSWHMVLLFAYEYLSYMMAASSKCSCMFFVFADLRAKNCY